MPYKIPLNKSTLEKDDLDAANEVLYSDRLTMGPLCEKFESAFAEYVGSRFAVFVNSGSSANLLAVFAARTFLGLASNTVRVPALTWSTTIWPIIQAGWTPTFKDCSLETFQTPGCDFQVHLLGNCEAPKAPLLEDCCESLGTYYRGRHVGTFGLAGTFVVKKRTELKVGSHNGEVWWSNYEVIPEVEEKYNRDLPDNFISVPYHPEYQSTRERPHPLLVKFIENAKLAMQNRS